MDAEETLRRVPLFRDLKPKQVATLAKWATTRSYPAGHDIVKEGDMGIGLYSIESGWVKISKQSASGPVELRTMGPGESFGELALLDDSPRSATVTAVEPTTAVLLDKMQFLAELRAFPEIALGILPGLVAWLREADAKIAELD